MTADDLTSRPLTYLARVISDRDLSPVELVQQYLNRIERHDRTLRAYITVCAERALEEARLAEREIAAGRYRGPLHGIPFAVKDQMLIAGVRVTGGSRLLAENVPDRDATVVARLKSAGGILLGTLNTHEFHMGPTSEFPYGTPLNPWNAARTTGGSSSGSASAVAASLCSVSLGGDTGGSIRAPAAFCGVSGLKATWSRVSRHGVFPLASSLDCVGPLARTAEDLAVTLGAIAGFDPLDPTTSRAPVPDFASHLGSDLRGVKIGLVDEMMSADLTTPAAREAVSDAVTVFERLGASVIRVSIPITTGTRYFFPALTAPEAASFHRRRLIAQYSDFDVNTRIGLMVGAALPAALTHLAQKARMVATRQVTEALRNVTALVGPTTPGGARPIEGRKPIRTTGEADEKLFGLGSAAGQHTRVYSLAGVPALTVPCGFDPDGLPLGLQIAGRFFDEVSVLRLGNAYQEATDWHLRRPAETPEPQGG